MNATSALSVESITTSAQMNPILLGPSACFADAASIILLTYDFNDQASCTLFEQALRHEPLAKKKGKEGHTGRFRVCVTSYRRRLTDQDNLAPKFFVDCLRYAGVIPDDSPQAIDYSITQVKVRKKEEERTEIEVDEAP